MGKNIYAAALLSILSGFVCYAAENGKTCADYVNFLIGTDIFEDANYCGNNSMDPDFGLYGNEIVGPRTPSGTVSPSPVSSFRGVTSHSRGSGYCHSDKYIMGFTQINTEYNAYMLPLVMPVVGRLETKSGDDDSGCGYRGEKDFKSEIAKPYYYTVRLKDRNVKVEITSTDHVGVYRYTFPKAASSKILVDLGISHKHSSIENATLDFVGDDSIEGSQDIGLITQFFNFYGQKIYFVIKFDKPFKNFGRWNGDKIGAQDKPLPGTPNKPQTEIGAFVDYITSENEQIQMKFAISLKSIEDARMNLSEARGWDFDAMKEKCKKEWNKVLSRIEVEGGTDTQKTLFYTGMARCCAYANVETISKCSTMNYQVLFLLEPKTVEDKIISIEKSGDFGRGFFGCGFIPYSLSFYKRGATKIDLESIFNRECSLVTNPDYERYAEYMKYGYIPYTPPMGKNGIYKMNQDCANRTLGYAYEFYCISEMAKLLGKDDKAEFFEKFSHGYKNIFDDKTRFMRGKTADGAWVEPFVPETATLRSPYNEGNAWHYSFMVFHDIPGLIELMGGKDAFIAKLDKMFATPYTSVRRDVGGMLGNYTHGNGNDRYIPYLYIETGCPWKTQKKLREIMDIMYRNVPGGLTNNDDYGNMSGWYVMSAMGIYPPINIAAADNFLLGSPLFKKITLRLPEYIYGGNTFTIECENYSPENIYVSSVELDGKPLPDFKMPMDALKNSRKLVFKMSDKPSK